MSIGTDSVEFYFDKSSRSFLIVDSSMSPNDGDLINIENETYKVLGRSFSVDYARTLQRKMRCNVIVEKIKEQA